MSKHKARTVKAPAKPRLTPEEFENFKLQVMASRNAAATHLMVQESYNLWIAETLKRHDIAGKARIDLQTGEITPEC